MLLRLATSNIKNRIRDYIVLLTGLVMSSAIFYMFANLATNQQLIKSNLNFQYASQVFIFGTILLMIITFVYVMYANTFLLNMRQHDYGLFMMLGAKRSRVGALMVLETLIVGIGATIIGILFGILITGSLSGFLFNRLGLEIQHFNPLYPKAVAITFVLFALLFVIASFMNLQSLVRTPVLQLLKQSDSVDKFKFSRVRLIIQGIAGIILVGLGYWSLASIKALQLMAIPIALITIVLGSYFIFKSSILLVITWIKKTNWAFKRLNGFTLSQIMFRVHDYTRILTITSLLFALALGAITVGAGFHREIPMIASSQSSFSLAINNPTAAQKDSIKKLNGATSYTYQQKLDHKTVYYNQAELDAKPFKEPIPASDFKKPTKFKNTSSKELMENTPPDFAFLAGTPKPANIKVVSDKAFKSAKGTNQVVELVTVKDIPSNYKALTKLTDEQNKRYPSAVDNSGAGAFRSYQFVSSVFGGLEFIGYFLGIAFLAMLASCLMFKILSGTAQDQIRYNLLLKIGTRRSLLKHSINRELLVLFVIPGVLGIIDVLFGLQMFKPLMIDPYYNISILVGIFVIMYLGYYFLTSWLYKLIVLPEKK